MSAGEFILVVFPLTTFIGGMLLGRWLTIKGV